MSTSLCFPVQQYGDIHGLFFSIFFVFSKKSIFLFVKNSFTQCQQFCRFTLFAEQNVLDAAINNTGDLNKTCGKMFFEGKGKLLLFQYLPHFFALELNHFNSDTYCVTRYFIIKVAAHVFVRVCVCLFYINVNSK